MARATVQMGLEPFPNQPEQIVPVHCLCGGAVEWIDTTCSGEFERVRCVDCEREFHLPTHLHLELD